MTQTPTIEQFFAMQDGEEDVETPDPLASIAESLRTIAAGMGGEPFTAELVVDDDAEQRMREAFDDLEGFTIFSSSWPRSRRS